MREILQKWGLNLNPDQILSNPDPYSLYLDFAEVNETYSKLVLEYEKLKLREKQYSSQLYVSLKNSAEKYSEKYIESLIYTSTEVLEIKEKIAEADALLSYLEGLMKTLEMKSILMNSLLADRRKGLSEV